MRITLGTAAGNLYIRVANPIEFNILRDLINAGSSNFKELEDWGRHPVWVKLSEVVWLTVEN